MRSSSSPGRWIKAVYGLALADDARCVEGSRQVGPVDRSDWPDTWLLDAAERYKQRHLDEPLLQSGKPEEPGVFQCRRRTRQ